MRRSPWPGPGERAGGRGRGDQTRTASSACPSASCRGPCRCPGGARARAAFGSRSATQLRGRVLDALGRPIDGGPSLARPAPRADRRHAAAPSAPRHGGRLRCRSACAPSTPCCPAGGASGWGYSPVPGVGKSSLLSMVARGTEADISVLALVGERGREVREMIEHDLGPAGLARSVVVVATSDEPALMRLQAAQTATRIAEWFRDRGRHVVLMMDSLTRYCMAQREVGLGRRRTAGHQGLPPVGLRPPARPAGARRGGRTREHNRPLHGAGRGRRHERTRSPTPLGRSSTAT